MKNGAPFRGGFGAILDEMTRFVAAITDISKGLSLSWSFDGKFLRIVDHFSVFLK